MSLLGKTIRLKGISQKGKNRVREHGERWVVLAETDRVLFAPNSPGPWLYVAPPGFSQSDKPSRWVHASIDLDFTVIADD